MREFSNEQRQHVLKFVSDCGKVPLDGFDPPFAIAGTDSGADSLPRAQTCFNKLILPAYPSRAALERKLLLAAENTVGFQFS